MITVGETGQDRVEKFGRTADYLIVNHVLEHVAEPIETLKGLVPLLNPGGVFYICLPFLENLPQWGFGRFFHIAHLYHFSIPYSFKRSNRMDLK